MSMTQKVTPIARAGTARPDSTATPPGACPSSDSVRSIRPVE